MKKLALVVLLFACAWPVEAQLHTQVVVTGVTNIVAYVADPLNPGIHLAVEQGGLVRVVEDGAILSVPFLDLRSVIASGGERGLLGLAFPPDATTGRVFVNFTNSAGHTVVARFRRSATTSLVIDPATRFDLRWPDGNRFIMQPYSNHNGGHLAFGPDGYLYIGLGDGGSGNDPLNNAQNPNTLLGKMLRIDVNVADTDPAGYHVPADNPFVDGTPIAALGEIWDFGLRNPWRYSFDDPALGGTGALFIADVGQSTREEVDFEPAASGARNYGWRIREGTGPTPGVPATTPAFTPLTDPMLDYGRSLGFSVTGGYVYRGRVLGAQYVGRYFFGDYGSGRVWSVAWHPNGTGGATVADVIEHTSELGSLGSISSFAADPDGELYILIYGGASTGRVLKIVPDLARPVAPTGLGSQVTGRTVTLTWNGSAGVTQYRLEVGSRAGASDLLVFDTGSTQTSLTAFAVPDGIYFVRVRAVGVGGVSDPSNEIVVTVGCTGPPAAPTAFTSSVSGRTVQLTWSAPADLTSIVLEVGSGPNLTDLAVFNLSPSARSISGTVPPGTYYARLRAVSACGTSGPSSELTVVVF